MSDAFNAAYFALEARTKIINVIANNLANAQTTGFKRQFSQVLESENMVDVGSAIDVSQGDMIATRSDLDVAINGSGFFAIQTPQGVRYTRAGNFTLNDAGDLVTMDGMSVLSDSDSPITVGQGKIVINDSGAITVDGNEVGVLRVVDFRNRQQLEKEGSERFKWTGDPADVEDVPEPHLKSGYLEKSNVNTVEEMVHLMAAYREFESIQKTIKTMMTDMNGQLIQEMGKLA